MTFDEWAQRWALPAQAIKELQLITATTCEPLDERSEAFVASECRLALGSYGIITMRNNVGALEDIRGRLVRYGLCNENAQMNKVIKSSDDVCIIPYIVKPQDIGRKLGVFLGVEHKRRNWVFTGKGRETPQVNFQRMVNSAGGVGLFANSAQSVIDSLVSQGLISPNCSTQ
jgi:hypothetical protein